MMRRKRMLEDLDQDIREYIEMETQDNIERGMPPEEARYAAVRKFGNVTRVMEDTREVWSFVWLEHIWQDVCYALRMLRNSPAFTAVCVLTIALGIGATTAIFSVVDATLLAPLPFPHPEQLVAIRADFPGLGAKDIGISQPEWQDFQHSGIFENVSPAWFDENNVTGASQPVSVRLLIVAPNYLNVLGVQPQLGRSFHPEDHSPGVLSELLINDGLWKRAFGADPHVLGKSVRMDSDLYQIVGVMPAGFDAPGRIAEERNIEVWAETNFYGAPMPDQPPRNRRNLPTAIARLRAGLTIAQAQSRLDALTASLQKRFPGDYPAASGWTVRLVPLKESVVGNVQHSLILLSGAVALVLLIGCVNVANLQLARASARGREMAIRQALGGGRNRLIRQLLTESVVLSVLGGIAGLGILFGAKGFLLRLVPEGLPRLNEVAINWSVMLFALVASLTAGVIFGLAPALNAGRLDLTQKLKQEGRGSTGSGEQSRMRQALVVTEFALSLVLMIAASLLLRSFWDLLNVRLGFRAENVMTVRTRLPYPNDPTADPYRTPAQEAAFVRELLRRGRTLPGVEEVAAGDTASIPLDQRERDLKVISEGPFFLTLEGREAQTDQPVVTDRSSVTPEYFHLLGIPLVRGRLFSEFDDDKAPQVAVVNEAFARNFWPDQDPIGKRFKSTRADSQWITVVGMIANARTESLAEAGVPKVYLNLYQINTHRLTVFLRGHLDSAAIPDQARAQIQAVDPALPVYGGHTLEETVSASLSVRRFSMQMVGLFALTALLLAGLGIYGVISYMVGERTHEIGIRVALGAQSTGILRMILRQGLGLAIAGAAVGLVGAGVVAHLMAGMLYGVKPTDPATFGGVALVLICVALLACYIPARRATRVDPTTALREA